MTRLSELCQKHRYQPDRRFHCVLFSLAQFAPEVHVGDGLGMDLKLSNQVFNSLKRHCYSEQRRSARLHEKKEHSTAVRMETPSARCRMLKVKLSDSSSSLLRSKPWTLALAC